MASSLRKWTNHSPEEAVPASVPKRLWEVQKSLRNFHANPELQTNWSGSRRNARNEYSFSHETCVVVQRLVSFRSLLLVPNDPYYTTTLVGAAEPPTRPRSSSLGHGAKYYLSHSGPDHAEARSGRWLVAQRRDPDQGL